MNAYAINSFQMIYKVYFNVSVDLRFSFFLWSYGELKENHFSVFN